MTASGSQWARVAAGLGLLAAAACSRPQPAVAPSPEAAPTPPPRAAQPPTAVAGTFRLQAVIQGRTIPTAPRGASRARAAAVAASAVLELRPTATAAPDHGVPSGTQLAAAVALPGYTMPPRGRSRQAATWWPGAGDSITVRWVLAQRNAAVWLRGILRGDTLGGDVWYTLMESGSEFQLGNFTAVRLPPPRRRTTR
jgi:hypothetical protein